MNLLPDSLCYLNGQYLNLCDAKVSVLDRGFIFGDGVYEALPVYGRKLFRFEQHMARLERSLTALRIANPLRRGEWLEHARTLITSLAERQGTVDQLVYLQVTRGVAPRDHAMPAGIPPTVFLMTNPMRQPTPEQRRLGVACVTAGDFRWERADIKSISLLGNVLARQISADPGATETILLRDGFLTEASSSNVWIVREGVVFGPPPGNLLLEGIRAGLLQELCAAADIAFERRPVPRTDMEAADEILLTSATKEVLPVTTLDGRPVGRGAPCGRPGPVYARLYQAYQQAKKHQSI